MSASSVLAGTIPDGVSALVIRQERLLLAVPADHCLADEVQTLEVEALFGETLILPQLEENAVFTDYVTDFVAASRPMPEQVYPVRGIPTAPQQYRPIADPCRRHEHSNRTQVEPVKGMARTHAQAWFCAPKLSAIRAVRATLSGERGCKLSIPMARIVSRYNQRVRQVGFEDESPW
jgi:hypothetical protein